MKPKVKITHPDGVQMPLSESLLAILAGRKGNRKPFFSGQWLATLSDKMLGQLITQLQALNDGADDNPGHDDAVSATIYLIGAEAGSTELKIPEKQLLVSIQLLLVASRLEGFRRRGWILIHSPLSINPDGGVHMNITPLGQANAPAMGTLH